MYNPRGHSRGLALGLLFAGMAQVGFDKIPPVTLATIGAQVAIFLRLFDIKWLMSIDNVCVSALHVWYREDWRRLFLAAFVHLDEWHLYYNMMSLLWKGRKLERRFGSVYFLGLVAAFAVLTNAVLVALAMLAEQLSHDSSYVTQCAAGFSGVLFALKVIVNSIEPARVQLIMGIIPVSTKMACWAELILIHFLVPNSSFLGHLAGILVGLLYVMGPLKWIFDTIFNFLDVLPRRPSYTYYSSSTSGHQRSGRNTTGEPHGQYRGIPPRYQTAPQYPGPPHYANYTGGLSEQEQLERAMRESRSSYAPPSEASRTLPTPNPPTANGSLYPDLSSLNTDPDELRRRRLARFARQS